MTLHAMTLHAMTLQMHERAGRRQRRTLAAGAASAFWAAAALWVSAGPAVAAPGTVRTTTYLRAGPGDQYAALDEVDPESQVDVQSCNGGWCRVRSGGAAGFIKADVLTAPDDHAKPPAPAANAPCFTADTNGRPRGGEEVRVCNTK